MGIRIGDTVMKGETSGHSASRKASGMWEVSWIPGHEVGRNEAITAMVLAETVSNKPVTETDPMWPFISGWAAELGMGPEAAILGIRQQVQRQA
jgi:hypothetical protein